MTQEQVREGPLCIERLHPNLFGKDAPICASIMHYAYVVMLSARTLHGVEQRVRVLHACLHMSPNQVGE